MTAGYKCKPGWNQAAINLVVMAPQPHSEGVQYARRTYAADGTIYEENSFVELQWSMIESVAEYQALLTQFNLDGATETSANVTLTVPEYNGAFNRFNGVAIRPEIGRDFRQRDYFIRDVVIVVRLVGYAS